MYSLGIGTMCNLGSILCGLVAWLIPGCELLSGRFFPYAAAFSGSLCGAALYLQLFDLEICIRVHDWAALLDTGHAEAFVSGALLVSALALNLLVCVKHWCTQKGAAQ